MSALVHTAAAGYFAAYVNGVRLGDGSVLAPALVNMGRSIAAIVYDAGRCFGLLYTWLAKEG